MLKHPYLFINGIFQPIHWLGKLAFRLSSSLFGCNNSLYQDKSYICGNPFDAFLFNVDFLHFRIIEGIMEDSQLLTYSSGTEMFKLEVKVN